MAHHVSLGSLANYSWLQHRSRTKSGVVAFTIDYRRTAIRIYIRLFASRADK